MPSKKQKVRKEPRAPQTPSERLVEALRTRFKSGDVALLMKEGGYARVTAVCPTGIEALDRHVIGIGGLPYGRGVELEGEEGSGKTTLLSKFMAAGQRDGCVVAFADSENKFNPEWGVLHGMDTEAIVQLQSETLEDFHEHALFVLQKQRQVMIALDSVAAIPTKLELSEGTDIPAEHARLWAKFLRPFGQLVARKQALCVFVNQPRNKIGVMYGNPETTFGGRALKHFYSLRLHVSHGKGVKEEGAHTARYMHVSANKNQLAPPHRKATLKLDYTEGFDDHWATINHAKDVGCLETSKAATEASWREATKNLGWGEAEAETYPDSSEQPPGSLP